MEMTKETLKTYRSNMDEIRELQYKLAHLGEGDSMIGNDVIFDYQTGFPRPQSVVGFDHDKYERRQQAIQSKIAKLEKECEKIEQWIEDIPDSLTRRIFRMVYIDGMTQRQIGKIIHLERSNVSKKIDAFLKVSHNSQKSHV